MYGDPDDARVAVIGGTGLYGLSGFPRTGTVTVNTPFGGASDTIMATKVDDTKVLFLPRHGRGHVHPPSNLPSRANINALKLLGVERIISINAVGALADGIEPRDAVVPDQLIDRTRGRQDTFFDGSVVAHIGFADPFCAELSALVADAAETHLRVHRGGTMVVIEGPAFSTRAESRMYRSWGGAIIGMTVLPEAKLAREMEMCYASLSLVTDRDSWHEGEAVTAPAIAANLEANADAAGRTITDLIPTLPAGRDCGCKDALAGAIITSPDLIGEEDRFNLSPPIDRYL